MKESTVWTCSVVLLLLVAMLAIFFRGLLSSDPMFVEMLATLLGVLIAIYLGEAFRSIMEEKKDERMKKSLIGELRRILKAAEQSVTVELLSPTWSSIKPTDIPSRLDSKLRVALASAYLQLTIYNYCVRLKREYYFSADPDEKKMAEITIQIREEKEKLVVKAREVLEMVD